MIQYMNEKTASIKVKKSNRNVVYCQYIAA